MSSIRLVSSARSTSSNEDADSARIVSSSSANSASPPNTTYFTRLVPAIAVTIPGRSAATIGAWPERTPKSPSRPGTSTCSTWPPNSSFSGDTRLNWKLGIAPSDDLNGCSWSPRSFGLVTGPHRQAKVALPDRSVVELNGDGVRRVDRAEIVALNPDPGRRREPIQPGAGRLAGFVQEVKLGPVLGDVGSIADETGSARLDASVRSGQIGGLRRCRGCGNPSQGTNGQCNQFHEITPRFGQSAQSDQCKLVRRACRPLDLHQVTGSDVASSK